MTYSYNNGADTVTNVYNAHDSYMIAKFMTQFIPEIIKQSTHSSDTQHKAYVSTNMMKNPLSTNYALAKHVGIR